MAVFIALSGYGFGFSPVQFLFNCGRPFVLSAKREEASVELVGREIIHYVLTTNGVNTNALKKTCKVLVSGGGKNSKIFQSPSNYLAGKALISSNDISGRVFVSSLELDNNTDHNTFNGPK